MLIHRNGIGGLSAYTLYGVFSTDAGGLSLWGFSWDGSFHCRISYSEFSVHDGLGKTRVGIVLTNLNVQGSRGMWLVLLLHASIYYVCLLCQLSICHY